MASNKGEVEFLRSEAQKLREALRHERRGRCAADGEVQVTSALPLSFPQLSDTEVYEP